MLKKVCILVISLFFAPVILAKSIVVGVSMYSLADKYPTYLQDSMDKFVTSQSNLKFKYADANGDPAKMLNDVENFIDSKVDALIIMPTDQKIVKAIGLKARKAKIPLIVVTVKPNEEDMQYVASYVGSEEIKSGEMQGKFIVNSLNGKPAKAIILLGPLGLEAQIKRTEGNKKIFAQHPEIKVVAEQEAKWDRAKGMEVAENLLSAHRDTNVILSNNDEMAIGAVLAGRKLGLKDEDLIIVGLDATPDALDYLGKGLDATVFQSAAGQGSAGAEMAYLAAKGEKVPAVKWVPFELVTPDKKEEYQARYKK